MGTGFIIHQDNYGSFILTCAHVVEQVLEPIIDGFDVEVKALGSSETIDLALLYVKGMFKMPFALQQRACPSRDVQLIGYSVFTREKYQGKTRDATILGDKITLKGIVDNTTYQAWQIIAKDNNEIEHGNSGGPLLCKESGKVIAVVSNNKGVKEGYAISIEHLQDIWDEIPPFLFESNNENKSPFVGLSAFSIEQSHLFFGRDKETHQIIEQLKEENLITVVGDSGSGKSSLIKAGIIPKYLNGILDQGTDSSYFLIDTRPAENAFNELSNNISNITKQFNLDFESTNQLKKAIQSTNPQDILNALEYIFKEDNATLLIYIDQFEELFTLCSEQTQKAFIELLLYLLKNQTNNLKIKIILTIRRDYYNLISEYPTFFEQTQATKYTLRRMTNLQLQECIEKPLRKTFIPEDKIQSFTKAVLHDMGDESGELALLQIALTQTWKNKNDFDNNLLMTYHQIGEVSGALSKLADDTWKTLEPSEQKILQYIFIRIIRTSDTGGVIRRLANKEEFSKERWNLAQKLASALDAQGHIANEKNARLGRLLTIKGDEGKVVELTHEALVRQWPMYQKWLKKVSKDNLKRIHDAIIEKSKIYQNNKESKFLLMGYELEESLRLLKDEYRAYLSTDEIAYIKKSQQHKLITIWGKIAVTIGIVFLLVTIVYLITTRISMSLKQLEVRIENNEISLFTKDNNYIDLNIPTDDKYKKETIRKLIKLSSNIDDGSEKKYWLQRIEIMDSDKLDRLYNILKFEAYTNKGSAKFKKALYQEAIEAYLEADKINPNKTYIYQYLGNAYAYQKKYQQAILFYKKMLDINPNDTNAYFSIGNTYNYMKEYNKAIEIFNKLLDINPNHEYAYTGIALAYNAMYQYKKAIISFKKVIDINPSNDTAYYSIGLAYGRMQQYTKAMYYAEQSVAINPYNLSAYLYMGNTYYVLKNYQKAIHSYTKALKINPQNYMPYTLIFELQLIQNQDFDKVLEKQYIKLFKMYQNSFIQYDMLKILNKISKKEPVDFNQWENTYTNIPLNWNFTLEEEWAKKMDDETIKSKVLKAITFFKNHR